MKISHYQKNLSTFQRRPKGIRLPPIPKKFLFFLRISRALLIERLKDRELKEI